MCASATAGLLHEWSVKCAGQFSDAVFGYLQKGLVEPMHTSRGVKKSDAVRIQAN